MLIKFWASYEQRLPACCQTVLVLWCAHLRLGDLKPGHHLWKTSIQIHRIYSACSLIWSHLTKYTIILTSILLPWIGFGINKWEKMSTFSLMKRDLESILAAWICIFIVSWSHFLAMLYSSSLFYKGMELVNKAFLNERHIWSVQKNARCCIKSYSVIFSRRQICSPSIYLHHICGFGVKTKQKLNVVRLSVCISC